MKKQFSGYNAMVRNRSLSILAGSLLVGAVFIGRAIGGSPSVTDLSSVQVDLIESGDIVEALAVPRGTKVRPGARPRVRLPVYFEFNSAHLKPEAKDLLEKVSKALTTSDLETFSFSVEGRTDSVGGERFNDNLSERRAEAVKKFLEDAGVTEGRLQSIGRGEASPVDSNTTNDGRKHNRRVEIINLGAQS